MAIPSSPLDTLTGALDKFAANLRPPDWLVEELQRRLVLFLNHVLQQEPEAMARLAHHTGRVVLAQWRAFSIRLATTPAGLLDLAAPDAPADLTLTMVQNSPFDLARSVLRGDQPGVRIEGDVQLATEVSWLVDHLRWDVEEDLSRLIGDAPAHALAEAARGIAAALRRFIGSRPGAGGDAPRS